MIRTLARNPLLRTLTQNWWLPVLVAPLFSVFLGFTLPVAGALAAMMPLIYGAAVVGIASAACAHGGIAALREAWRHERQGHRFLCPHCLRFGEFRFACWACGHEVDPLIVHTRGAYVNDCAECGARLCARDGKLETAVQAFCRHCSRACEREIHHERRVRVIGTLRESDFTTVCDAIGVEPARTLGGIDRGGYDDGERMTFVLSLAKLPGFAAMLPDAHALWSIEQLWLDGSDGKSLDLGEASDRFLHRSGLSEARRQRLTVTVGGTVPDGPARRLLNARFGKVVYRVPPAALVGVSVRAALVEPALEAVEAMEGAG